MIVLIRLWVGEGVWGGGGASLTRMEEKAMSRWT